MTSTAALRLGGGAALLYCTYEFWGFPTQGLGPSMYPTFAWSGDVLWVSRLSPRKSIDRGQVVAFRNPTSSGLAIKRVIALEGDVVRYVPPSQSVEDAVAIREGRDGEAEYREMVVPAGRLWVEGDNPDLSRDSRHFGPLPRSLVVGTVSRRLLPWKRAGLVADRQDYGLNAALVASKLPTPLT